MEITGTTLEYEPGEEHILRRLGWAVITQWDALPKDIREGLVRQAVLSYDKTGLEPVQLQQTIDTFIKKHVGK